MFHGGRIPSPLFVPKIKLSDGKGREAGWDTSFNGAVCSASGVRRSKIRIEVGLFNNIKSLF
jgi:hypothetical protein